MDIKAYNRKAWDSEVIRKNIWTVPVSSRQIERARKGKWEIFLTPRKPVPPMWIGEVRDKKVLCLASGGGQQGPILAAAGAVVTVFDNSTKQLEQDQFVAKRDGLDIDTVQGDMRDLSRFENRSFDLIIHPVSNTFVPDILPVWKEAYRVLKEGGSLLSGFDNPVNHLFDWDEVEKTKQLKVKFKIPYSDEKHLDKHLLKAMIKNKQPLEFGHSLQNQLGGQIQAGFILIGYYDDSDPVDENPLAKYIANYGATNALKIEISKKI
ncbi:MAG: class I SAM-dependent methyltransferase [bacterium]